MGEVWVVSAITLNFSTELDFNDWSLKSFLT